MPTSAAASAPVIGAPTAAAPRSLAATRAVFKSGDGLRGWGSLAVFMYHAAYFSALFATGIPGMAPFGHLAKAFVFGDPALSIFFGLSGYLIARPFARSWVLDQPMPSIRRYAGHRARRIVPVLWVTVPLAIAYFGTTGTPLQVLEVFTLTAALFLSPAVPSMSHSWSLFAEAGYYAVLPVLALGARPFGRSPGRKVIGGLLALLVLFIAVYALRSWIGQDFRYQTTAPAALYAFLPGTALAVIEPIAGPWCADHRPAARVIALIGAMVSVAAYATYLKSWHPVNPALLSMLAGPRLLAITATATALLGALLVAQWATGWAPKVLVWAPIRWLGVRSYPFYIVHLPVLWAIQQGADGRRTSVRFAEAIVIGLPLTIAIGALIHAVVERPILEGAGAQAAALRRLAGKLRSIRPAVGAALVAAPVLLLGAGAATAGGFLAHQHVTGTAPTTSSNRPDSPFGGVEAGTGPATQGQAPVGGASAASSRPPVARVSEVPSTTPTTGAGGTTAATAPAGTVLPPLPVASTPALPAVSTPALPTASAPVPIPTGTAIPATPSLPAPTP